MRFTFQKVAATLLLASLRTHQIRADEVPIGSPYFKKVTDILYNDNFSHGMLLASSDNSGVVAISGVLYDSDADTYRSSVLVYRDNNDGTYVPVGSVIEEEASKATAYFRDALADVALNGAGDRLAIAIVKSERGGAVTADNSTVTILSHDLTDINVDWNEDVVLNLGKAGGGGFHMGLKVAFNYEGDALAIGERYYEVTNDEGTLKDAGRVLLHSISKDGVNPVVTTLASIQGARDNDHYGSSVAMATYNNNPCVIVGAVGAEPSANSTPIDNGKVQVFCVNDASEVAMRPALYGVDSDGEFGHSVSTNSDASVIAVGARFSDQSGKVDNGLVRVYKWSGTSYQQIGLDLFGERGEGNLNQQYYVGDEFGYSVSLSDVDVDGNIRIAIGAPKNDPMETADEEYYLGSVYVYEINVNSADANTTWQKIGQDIDGTENGEKSGQSVALSKDGLTLIVGSPGLDDRQNGHSSGGVKVYTDVQNSHEPSSVPSVSSMPSLAPSVTSAPSTSKAPSNNPTSSPQPSYSAMPSESPLGTTLKAVKVYSNFVKFDPSRKWCVTANELREGSKIHVRPCSDAKKQYQTWNVLSTGQVKSLSNTDLCMRSFGIKIILGDCDQTESSKFFIEANRIRHVKNGGTFFVGFDPESKYERLSLYREGSLVPSLYNWEESITSFY